MIKGNDVLNHNVIALSTGEKVERVYDIIFDRQANWVIGFLVDEGGWFSTAKVVPFERVHSIGEDAVMIGRPEDVNTTREDRRLQEALDNKTSLAGLTLLTTDGQNLGRIADVFFDEHTGRVEGYEATGGLFSDLSSGRTFVPAPESVQIGADTAIVPASVAQAMEEQEDGGLKGALNTAAENVKGAYENIAEATRERQKDYVVGKTAGGDITTDDGHLIVAQGDTITAAHAEAAEAAGKLVALATAATGGALAESYGQARDRVQDTYEDVRGAAAERQKAYVVGKTARSEVATEAGEVIVPAGATITRAQADRAEQAGRLAALTATATGGALQDSVDDLRQTQAGTPATIIGRRAKTDVRTAGGSLIAAQGQIVTPALLERARQAGAEQALVEAAAGTAATGRSTGRVSEQAGNLLDRARHWLDEKREQAEEALERREGEALEQRVREALGRPVTRVILAPDDRIILNIGEVVTHKAVQAARDARMLDVLVDSVEKDSPDINPLTSRPHTTGEAALEGQAEPVQSKRQADL
ncbi:PRC-barrel domain-containing protein [uncultured Deinococcus sp.]|uniref:PRC-barrel domain-containing protein n=1 Tax=uncultured Deinococcus sp. TaxID=158789 RepID=UPI00258443D7|nr:PRC-barrel domain-containing protein [uncultured Deinococcus sp.]